MDWIDLGNPRPRPEPVRYTPIKWPTGETIPLPFIKDFDENNESIFRLLLRRRTHREFGAVSIEMLGSLTWITCHLKQIGSDDLGFPLSLRPCLSAGAIHPIHLLIIRPNDDHWYRYIPVDHTLQVVQSNLCSQSVLEKMQIVLEAPKATLIILAAEPGMTASKYDEAESLVWRDSGVLLGFLAIASCALNLSFCPLGVTGEPWVSRLVTSSGLVGVGAAFLGSIPISK